MLHWSIVAIIALAGLSACAPMTQRVQVDQAAVDTEAKFQKRIVLEGGFATGRFGADCGGRPE